MFGASFLKLGYRVVIFGFGIVFIFSWLVATAVAQSTQTGIITGVVHNGTTGMPAPAGTEVTLHAYNSSYTATETMTSTLDENGRFQFILTDQPADWVYLVSTDYQDLSFSSNIAALKGDQQLDLSLTIYDPTSNPASVQLNQLILSLAIVGQQVQVSELYTFANDGTAVFRGNDQASGVEIVLPAQAGTPKFERGMGPTSGYFPANEVVPQDGRWYDTIPLRPGPNSLTLRVTYQLPLGQSVDLSRELPYPTNAVTVIVPDDGPQFVAEGWQQLPTQSMGQNGVLLTYALSDLDKGSKLVLSFSGTAVAAQPSTDAGDWIISIAILLLALYVGRRLLQPQNSPIHNAQVKKQSAVPGVDGQRDKRRQMLLAIADLDNAFQHDELTETEYHRQRQEIKNQLSIIWETE